MAVTAVMASALGGYVTGRLRVRWARAPLDEVYFRDTAHGVLAWAFATVMGAALLASAATVVGSGAAANPAPSGTTTANDITAPFLDRLFRPNYAVLTGGTGQQAAGVFAAGRDLAADRDVARRMLLTFRERGHTELSADDRQYLVQMVMARTGLPQADAERRVAAVETDARAALDNARRIAMQLSFWLVAADVPRRPRRGPRRHRRRCGARWPLTPPFHSSSSTFPQPQPPEIVMGRSILLWLVGVPIPIIILLALFWR